MYKKGPPSRKDTDKMDKQNGQHSLFFVPVSRGQTIFVIVRPNKVAHKLLAPVLFCHSDRHGATYDTASDTIVLGTEKYMHLN